MTINGGTLDNTSGSSISLFNNNAQTWGNSFTWGGSNALSLGTGAVSLTANITVTTNGTSALHDSGVVSVHTVRLSRAMELCGSVA